MKRMLIGTMTATLALAAWSMSACSSKKSSPPSSKKSSDEGECNADAKVKKKNNLVDDGFGLVATSYDDIKGIIDDNCLACHGKGGGLGKLDLSTYSALKKAADAVISVVESEGDDVMPPVPADPLSASDIKALKAWVKDGKKEEGGDSSEDSSSDSCDSNKKPSSDDEDDDDDLAEEDPEDKEDPADKDNKFKIDPELYEFYFEPPEMKNCHTLGKAYLRNGTQADTTPRCDDTNYPAKFTCDEAGVLAAFNNNAQVVASMAAKKTEGFIIDQCAEANSKPVVYLVCFRDSDNKCVAPENLKTDTLTIETSKIAME